MISRICVDITPAYIAMKVHDTVILPMEEYLSDRKLLYSSCMWGSGIAGAVLMFCELLEFGKIFVCTCAVVMLLLIIAAAYTHTCLMKMQARRDRLNTAIATSTDAVQLLTAFSKFDENYATWMLCLIRLFTGTLALVDIQNSQLYFKSEKEVYHISIGILGEGKTLENNGIIVRTFDGDWLLTNSDKDYLYNFVFDTSTQTYQLVKSLLS